MLALIALAMGGFGIGTTEFVAMGLLPEIAAGLSVTEPVAGHTISAYALGVVVGAPLIAVLGARLPRKPLLLGMVAVFVLGNAASVIAPTYETLIAARFLAGFPHGAYFGLAALAAAHIAEPGKRAKSVALVMMGLSVANVIGVPVAAWLGQHFGWRAAFALVAIIGLVTMAAIWRWVPALRGMTLTRPRTELGALRRPQVLLTLAVGMVGFGGMFAVYTYISTALTDVSGLSASMIPVALMIYGVGMVAGNFAGGALADRALVPGLFVSMGALTCLLVAFVFALGNPVTALLGLFLIGAAGASMVPGLQTRLMDVAADAQSLAASLNHAALNLANAFGAWIGGVVIAAGFGYRAPAAVGAVLAAGGLVVLVVAVLVERRSARVGSIR
ncbi:MFS transporter [Rhodococcus triatomae]|nr:MFS transporter [Rhodococcus triatomae]QNG25842.1 MFS transporter [Rhodococcus triatomae]